MYNHALPIDGLEYDKVVEVPVQDTRQLELAEAVHIQRDSTGTQLQLLSTVDQLFESNTFEGNAATAAQIQHIDPMPVVSSNHRQASQAAFSRFGLQYHGQTTPGTQGYGVKKSHGRGS
jgi:hypothetical protein